MLTGLITSVLSSFKGYIAAFLLGMLAMYLWGDNSLDNLILQYKTAEVEAAKKQTQEVIKDAKDSGDNTSAYLDELKKAKNEISILRNNLNSGAIKLRKLQAELEQPGVQGNASSTAKTEAYANSAADRERIISLMEKAKELDAWSASCWEWVNRSDSIALPNK